MSDPTVAAGIQGHPVGKVRNPWGAWGLSFITCGIYYIYWWYKINEELKEYDTQIQVEPGLAALALFVPICNVVSIFRTAERISKGQETGGAVARANGWLGILLALLFSLHVVYYQTALNDLWASGGVVPYGDPPQASGAEAI